jgi:hypothetical protein
MIHSMTGPPTEFNDKLILAKGKHLLTGLTLLFLLLICLFVEILGFGNRGSV